MEPISVYLHIPFCLHRCSYCDFNTYAGIGHLIPEYCKALQAEIQYTSSSAGKLLPVHTLFFGGGTPSLLSLVELEAILFALERAFVILPGAEITLEANPGTLTLDYLKGLRTLGVNRLSLGMQSSHPEELFLLERQHGYPDVVQALDEARRAGFDNLNLDLIFGLPGQSLHRWVNTLELALGLQPEHFSLYALALEHGTPLKSWVMRGLVNEPDPDNAAEMYEIASQKLADRGYEQYEISNWARWDGSGDLLHCWHNLQYWRLKPYLGLGAGAHGFAGGLRVANVRSPSVYIHRLENVPLIEGRPPFPQTPASQSVQVIDAKVEMGEVMMMGLRLTSEGVRGDQFQKRFGCSLQQVYGELIERLVSLGLLEMYGESLSNLRLTQRGRLLGNRVFMEFI